MSKQRDLLDKIKDVFKEDERISVICCVGSVASGTETGESDLDLSIFIKDRYFNNFIIRENFDNLFKNLPIRAYFLYPPEETKTKKGMCIALSFDWTSIDIACYKESNVGEQKFLKNEIELDRKNSVQLKVNQESLKECEISRKKLREYFYRFWLDAYFFSKPKLIESCPLECIRGLTILRERHLLSVLFSVNKKLWVNNYKNLSRLTAKPQNFENRLEKTLPTNCKSEAIKTTFKAIISLFEDVWNLADCECDDHQIEEIKKQVFKHIYTGNK